MGTKEGIRDMNCMFTEASIQLASSNYESQEDLFLHLRRAFQMSRLDYSDIADELGISNAEVRDWLEGEVNLSLADLRQLANAVDAHITYRVAPLRTSYAERLAAIASSRQWVDNKNDWAVPADPKLVAHS